MLRAVGIDQRAALESGAGVYVVAEANIKYRGSAKLDDELVVVSRVLEVRSASCVIDQRVMRGAEVLTYATVTAAFITPDDRDRKSVVSGKSVSVRVDLGGVRLIKKQK